MKDIIEDPYAKKSGPGKGSRARNLSRKFRKNYDKINWKKGKKK